LSDVRAELPHQGVRRSEKKSPTRSTRPGASSVVSALGDARTAPSATHEGNTPPRLKKTEWPKPYVWKEDCVGCEVCVAVCPFQALDMFDIDGESIAGLADPKACVGCGLCEQACPLHATQLVWPEPAKQSA